MIEGAPTMRSLFYICYREPTRNLIHFKRKLGLDGHYTSQHYPEHLRRVRYKDAETEKTLVFLTNHFDLPALTVVALYKNRWQVELFFK